MKRIGIAGGLALALLCAAPSPLEADLLIYDLGVGEIVLQGELEAVAGGTWIYTHPRFGKLYFKIGKDITRIEAPSLAAQFNKAFNKAKNKKDAEAVFQAGVWALKHGMLRHYLNAVDETLLLNPQHERALQIVDLRERMAKPIEDYKEQERQLREFVKQPQFKIDTSEHFIIIYDTPDEPPKHKKGQKKRKPRHRERLDLLENVYQSFLLTFFSRGIDDLEIPQEKLMVVLFNDERMYMDFSIAISPELRSASGYWSPENNISVFYDHGSNETFQAVQGLLKEMDKEIEEIKKERNRANADIIQFHNMLHLLIDVEQENMDITVVSHEATHQMAGNTGLLPRGVMIPAWVHEGLATYFEAPADGAWAGIGAVNERRLELYSAIANVEELRQYSHLNFIVGDQIFEYAGNHFTVLVAYSQAWALTHFMLERHPDQFIKYYRVLGEMPRDVRFNEEVLTALFSQVFGDDLETIDQQWRGYMRTLKTDVQKIREKAEE